MLKEYLLWPLRWLLITVYAIQILKALCSVGCRVFLSEKQFSGVIKMMFAGHHEIARSFFQVCSHLNPSFFIARKIHLNIKELFLFMSSCSVTYSFPKLPTVLLDLSVCIAQCPKTLEKNGLAVLNWRSAWGGGGGGKNNLLLRFSFKQCARSPYKEKIKL